MPKKPKADNKTLHAIFVLSLAVVVGGSAIAIAYFTSASESSTLASQTISANKPRLSAVDKDFLRTNKLKFSQNKKTDFLHYLSAGNQVIPLSTGKLKNAREAGDRFVKDYARFFGAGNSRKLVLQESKKDDLGLSHIVYQQKINSVPVFGGEMVIHVKNDLSIKSAAGKLLSDLSVKTTPKISARSAGTAAKKIWKKQFSNQEPSISAGKLYIFNKNLLNKHLEDKNFLVWEIKANDAKTGMSETYYIDAESGKLLQQITNVKTLNRRIFNCDGNRERGLCSNLFGTAPNRERGDRTEGGLASNSNEVNNAYQMVGQAHNYFDNVHGTNGANASDGLGDNQDGHPRASTDVYADWLIPRDWRGDCPNAMFVDNKLMFCPNTVSLAVVGHEYSHAVSRFYGRGLVYAFESGAIEEAIADIMGQGVLNYANGAPNWRIDLTNGNILRNFADPSSLNNPDRYYSSNFYCGDDDFGGVHTNSNVISHAAYLLATGADFNGCDIYRLGFEKMEKIFFRALDRYLLSNADFNDLYFALDNACSDLYDETDCSRMRRALQAVEIDQSGPCGNEPALPEPTCASPYIVSASANPGYYHAGQNLNLQFKFSKPLSSTAPVGVWANLGGAESVKICEIDLIANYDTASCSFKIHEGDNSARLLIDRMESTVAKQPLVDEDGVRMTSSVPRQNMPKGNVIIDTEKPTGSAIINNGAATVESSSVQLSHIARDNNSGVEQYRVSNDGLTYSIWMEYATSSIWDLYNADAGGGVFPSNAGRYDRTVYVQFKDRAGNVSETYSDNVTFNRMATELRTPSFSAATSSAQQNSNAEPESESASAPSVSYPNPSPVQLLVREPDFTLGIKQNGLTSTLTGAINYWGKGGSCENPRSTNPIIVRWGDGSAAGITFSGKNFSASHAYKKGGSSYDLSVTLTNNCSGYKIKRLIVKP